MEFVPGGTLLDRIRDPDSPLPLPWTHATRLLAGVAEGLGAAHAQGIVHRDVKPSNVLLVDRAGDAAKIADFGIAKLSGSDTLTREGSFVGTVGYLSPEQALGMEVDARTDVYSLGITWYRLLTGRNAFDGTTAQVLRAAVHAEVPDPRSTVPGIPSTVAELLSRMTATERDRRPKDGGDVARAMRSLLGVAAVAALGVLPVLAPATATGAESTVSLRGADAEAESKSRSPRIPDAMTETFNAGPPPRYAGTGDWMPLQIDVSLGLARPLDRELLPGDSSPLDLALHVGTLIRGRNAWPTPFGGGGIELTVADEKHPYRWSIGATTRVGWAIRGPGSRLRRVPDGFAYLRFTPFFGMAPLQDEAYLQGSPEVSSAGGGFRIGVGVTVPAWVAVAAPTILTGGTIVASGVNNFDEAMICCFLATAAALLNHVELTYEVYDTRGGAAPEHAWIFRIGAGF